jgi:hypothetical protein
VSVVRFYNNRGTAERPSSRSRKANRRENDRLSCRRFRFQHSAARAGRAGIQLCYNSGNLLAVDGVAQANRDLVAEESAATAGEYRRALVKHVRYYWLFLVE